MDLVEVATFTLVERVEVWCYYDLTTKSGQLKQTPPPMPKLEHGNNKKLYGRKLKI